MNELIIDILGWAGGIVLVIAFGMNSMGKITAQSKKYQFMNITAGIALVINSLYHGAYPLTFVNTIWVGIASVALVKIYGKK